MRREEQRPNIVVILSDEHDASVTGRYGHPVVQTPHLDRLAGQGLLFDRAYCTSPMCVPSRLSLLTGKYCHQIGAWDNGVIPGPDCRSWGHYLAVAGYETVLCGRTHFNGRDRRQGFTRRLHGQEGRVQVLPLRGRMAVAVQRAPGSARML